MGVEVARRAFSHVPHRSRHALYASDGGSSVGSHGFEWESTPTMLLSEEKAEKSEENAVQSVQTVQTQLNRFEEGVKCEEWKPVVMLVEDTATLRLLAQYLKNNVGNGGGFEVGRELRADVAMEFVRGVAGRDESMHQFGVFDLLREVDSLVRGLAERAERTNTISNRCAACSSGATRSRGGCFSPTSCSSTKTPASPSISNSSLSVSTVSLFQVALSCSLTHLLAAQSPQFASSVHTFHQFITALASSRSGDGQKGLWSNYHIAEQLDLLLRADYASLPVAVKEASIQRSESEPSGVLRDAAVLRLLSNDHGNGTKLRVPFLSTVSIGSQLPFSRKLYTHLLKRLQEEENSVVLPNLFSLFPSRPEKPFAGLLDYWLLDGEQKQCSVKARDVVDLVVIERLPQTEDYEGERGFSLSLSVPLAKLTNKKKKVFTGKYSFQEAERDEETQTFSCVVGKTVVTMNDSGCVFIDSVEFGNVTFMTVSNRYFSRVKSFPLNLPFSS